MRIPDYELADVLELTAPAQFQALAGPVRPKILALLSQRALSTQQIAQLLEIPKGTAAHHLKVLESAGLIRVVRTRQVRALTEKYYGRVARLHRLSAEGFPDVADQVDTRASMATLLRHASSEVRTPSSSDDPSTVLLVRARISQEQARGFAHRLEALLREFSRSDTPGNDVYGFVAGVYLTGLPDVSGSLGDEET